MVEEAHGYEFGGPYAHTPHHSHTRRVSANTLCLFSIGASLISFGLPVACYAFAFLCNDVSGCPAPSLLSPSKLFTSPIYSSKSGWQHAVDTLAKDVGWPGWMGLINVEGALGALGWYALSLLLYVALPAHEVNGTELRSGGKLKYRFNGESVITCLMLKYTDRNSLYFLVGRRRRLRHGNVDAGA